MRSRHPCLVLGCPERVPGHCVTCGMHWAMVPRELRHALHQTRGASTAIALVRLLAWLNSMLELAAVTPPAEHTAVLWGRSCTGCLDAALRACSVAGLDGVRAAWERHARLVAAQGLGEPDPQRISAIPRGSVAPAAGSAVA